MADQDKILQFLRMHGPSLPAKVAKAVSTEILFASAMLSDLAAQGKIKISHLKIGGSPLYYLPGQEHRLRDFAAGNLNPKDVGVLNQLQEQKVLRESEADLLMKVALRELQDFAVPLKVSSANGSELFWKWHLASVDDANALIRQKLGIAPASEPPVAMEHVPAVTSVPSITVPDSQAPPAPPPVQQHTLPAAVPETASSAPALPEEKKLKPPREKRKLPRRVEDITPKIEHYFRSRKVTLEQKETVRKNAESNFLVKVPSAVGEMRYFCKVKSKKRCDEKDLSAAYMEAQMKKLPLLFLYTHELSPKAQEMLDSGALENAVVKKLE